MTHYALFMQFATRTHMPLRITHDHRPVFMSKQYTEPNTSMPCRPPMTYTRASTAVIVWPCIAGGRSASDALT